MKRTFWFRSAAMAALLALSPVFGDDVSPKVTSEEALKRLKDGNTRFVKDELSRPNQSLQRRLKLAQGQEPFAAVLSCADSRVPPEIVFDQGLGDLFVVRIAGNIMESGGVGSLEYAVEHLHVPLIVVLGHQHCGAVAAAVKGGEPLNHVKYLLRPIQPAVKASEGKPGDKLENSVKENVAMVVRQLSESKPYLGEMVKSGKLKIVGGYYDWDTGSVTLLPEAAPAKTK
jgi:carbonic anhydrase